MLFTVRKYCLLPGKQSATGWNSLGEKFVDSQNDTMLARVQIRLRAQNENEGNKI